VRRIAACLLAAGLGAAPPAVAQRDWSKVEVGTVKLTDNVYMLTGVGGNIGLAIGDEAVFLVDDQYAPLTEKVLAAIGKLTAKPVRFVLNTHWHGDHTGGNENLGRGGAIVVAHENVRKRMSAEQFSDFTKSTTPPSPRGALPVVTFSGGSLNFHLNGEELRAFHVPHAHTDGDTMIHFAAADVIHTGDVFWNGLYPLIDVASGGSVEGTIAACDRALALAGPRTQVIPGHGPLAGAAELRAYRDMLATVSGRVRAQLAAGRSAAEIAASDASAEFDAKWGHRFIPGKRFLEMLAADLGRGPDGVGKR
jgi:glyoxylase-like metal-dependent hydrolase (beta-lactamase superfamily II)